MYLFRFGLGEVQICTDFAQKCANFSLFEVKGGADWSQMIKRRIHSLRANCCQKVKIERFRTPPLPVPFFVFFVPLYISLPKLIFYITARRSGRCGVSFPRLSRFLSHRRKCLRPAIRYNDNIYVHQCTGVLLKRPYNNIPTAGPAPMAAGVKKYGRLLSHSQN